MFSRRHPFLYFVLVFTSILSSLVVGVSLVVLMVIRSTGVGGFIQTGDNQVGVIEIIGPIRDAGDTLDQIKRFRKNKEIRAIVVRIDSPGGAVGPSQEIYREIRKTRKEKIVVASMGSMAASGGYYIAAGADKAVANPGTLTGSIGVIMGFANYSELLKKIGLVPVVVKSGEYKDMGSSVRDMTPKEKALLEALTRKIHLQFIRDIGDGRNMELETVESLADGRIFTGEEALALGLVDRLGNVEDAIEWAGRLGGIDGDVSAVYVSEKRLTFLEYLLMHSGLEAMLKRFFPSGLQADFMFDPSSH